MRKIIFVLLVTLGLLVGLVSAVPAAAGPPEPELKPPPGPIIDPNPIDIGPYIRDAELPIEGKPKLVPKLEAVQAGYNVGDERDFLTLDNYFGSYFFTTFTVMVMTDEVEIWVQNDLRYYDVDDNVNLGHPKWPETITQAQLDYLRDEYINTIEPTDLTYFGTPDVHTGANSLLAAWGYVPEGYYERADGGDATIILVANVRDELFYDPTYPSYIAGFFSPSLEAYGDRNFITIDCLDWEARLGPEGYDWGVDGQGPVYRPYAYESTTVHEFQHLIHSDKDPNEATWVNEGCSEYSEYLASYKTEETHGRTQFLDWPENSLVVWGDQPGEILADYQMVYLWTLRLGEKYGSTRIRDLVAEEENGILGVNAVYTETTFLDEFNGFRDEVLWGDYTSTFPTEWGWGAGVSPDFDMGRLLRNLNNEGYDTSGAPPYGTDYIKTTYGPGLGTISFDGDEVAPPTRWQVTSDLPIAATGDVSGNVLYSGHSNLDERWVIFPASVPTDTATLSLDTFYNIEDDWDYGFVQVTTDTANATGFTSLSNSDTVTTTDPSAHPIIVANVPGFSGLSNETEWVNEVFDLSPYAGQDILLAFRYATDWASGGSSGDYPAGWYIDNVKVGDTFLFTETLPTNAMSIKQAQGWKPDFRASIFTYEHDNPSGWVTKNDMLITTGTLTGTFDLSTVLTDTSKYAVVATTGVPPLMDGIVGSGLTSEYIPDFLAGMPGSIATSDVEITGRSADFDYPGGWVTYTVSLRNTGDVTVTGVTVTNPVPDNTSFITATNGASLVDSDIVWTGDVPANSTVDISFEVEIDDCVIPDTEIVNTTTFDDGLNPAFDREVSTRVRSPFGASFVTAPTEGLEVGDLLTYTVGLINTDSAARMADVRALIPEDTSFEYFTVGKLGTAAADDEVRALVNVPPYAEVGAPTKVGFVFRVESGASSPIAQTVELYEYGCVEPYHTYDLTAKLTYRIYLPLVFKSYTPPAEFTILHTNDFHGNLESDYKGRGGSAYIAGVVNDVRAEEGGDNVFLVDAGDVFFGAPPISQLMMGESTIDIYNMLEYEVAAFGNHEFDKGQTVLISRTLQSDFPWVGANIVISGTEWSHPTWVEPYVVLSKGEVDLGVIGLDTDETPQITLKGTTEGLVFKNLTESVLHYYDEVKAQSDALVVIAHMGTEDSGPYKGLQTVAQELIDAGKPVDLMIGGHQHEYLDEPVWVGDTPIIVAYKSGRVLGRADVSIDLDTKSLTLDNYEYITINNELTPDPDVEARVAYWADQVAPFVEQFVGYTDVSLVRNYNAESNMGNMVTDGMLWKADEYDDGEVNGSVDIAFTNPGGLRADIEVPLGATLPFTITWGDTFNVMPFGNTLYLMDLTGAQIQTLLDQAATLYKGILQTSGATWKWSNDCQCDTPTTWDAFDVMVNGEPLAPETTYRVVTNNFLAGGQDGWVTFAEGTNRWDTYYNMQEGVNEYIQWYNDNVGPIDHEVEGRIVYVP